MLSDRLTNGFPPAVLAAALLLAGPWALAGDAADGAAPTSSGDSTSAGADERPAPQPRSMPAGVIELDETVISGNQELPKVLYIVPWQQPDGLPDIELKTDFTEVELFRRLYPPAYRRELGYFEATQATADTQANDSKE